MNNVGIMYIEIRDRDFKIHTMEMLYESFAAARAARDQMLPLLNWMMRETAIMWYRITIE